MGSIRCGVSYQLFQGHDSISLPIGCVLGGRARLCGGKVRSPETAIDRAEQERRWERRFAGGCSAQERLIELQILFLLKESQVNPQAFFENICHAATFLGHTGLLGLSPRVHA